MKILTIIGTRPELIRLSIIIEKLDIIVDHIFVYTNQNYDYNLSGRFFDEMKIRKPDYFFEKQGTSFGNFLSNAILDFEKIIIKEQPNKILILGDTNSGLLGIIAERYKIPVYHMEAGNRCYDNRLPEETNRRIIDSISKYNLPYTENSKQNLLNEGYHKNFVFKTGNPIYEVILKNRDKIRNSNIHNKLKLNKNNYVLVTMHRAENVDDEETLNNLIIGLNIISRQDKVVISLHPRTKNKLNNKNIIQFKDNIQIIEPIGFYDFILLEMEAKCVISDSGTVQEECCIFKVPALTIRRTTERQETIECGSNILCGTNTDDIVNAYNINIKRKNDWIIPEDYLNTNVSDTIINILIGKL
ncbi:MAG: UDP-N-acetylglucosamine 2-epimerase (non-hydrolyzing) [Bacteroidales bacterium]|jgi:UDP-N-acetylglucosamine 2-epimerase (non-hydrolysing)|nr:UDP-N-acetylglucosamine 2-epimerase (non-hydrolyzing) [Bacteroidales bacterium]